MGYSDDTCMFAHGHFTEQQKSRVRCYTLNGLQQYLQFQSCRTVDDCKASTKNLCLIPTCERSSNGTRNICKFAPKNCNKDAGKPCMRGTCNPSNGACTFTEKKCLPPVGLEHCAVATCNPKFDKCQQNITNCRTDNIKNDCCKTADSPFCVNLTVSACVCETQSHCCYKSWDKSCAATAGLCGSYCGPPPLPFPKTGAKLISTEDLTDKGKPLIFRGTATTMRNFSCSFLEKQIVGYGAEFNIYANQVSLPTVFVSTCWRDLPQGLEANYVPTGILIRDYKTESCINWNESPETCSFLAALDLDWAATEYDDFLVFVYTTTPNAPLTIGIGIKNPTTGAPVSF